jgi:pimeloyl-ACP methyl ester carboxylesterase
VLVDVVPDPPPARTRTILQGAIGADAKAPLVDDILARAEQLTDIAARLTVPILLVRGGGSSPLDDDDVERLRLTVPRLRIATIPGAGHLVARDAPADLAQELLAFAHPLRA